MTEPRSLEALGYSATTEIGSHQNVPTAVLLWENQLITVQLHGAQATPAGWEQNIQELWEALKDTGGGANLQQEGITASYWQTRLDTLEQVQFVPSREGAPGSIRFVKKSQERAKGLMQRMSASIERARDRSMPQQIQFPPDQEDAFRAIHQAIGVGSLAACPACGKPIKTDAAFCPNCGHNLNEARVAQQPQCPNCGAALDPASKFCAKCGTRMTSA